MAAQQLIPGLIRLEVDGLAFDWSANHGAYLSNDAEARCLTEDEMMSWRMSFNTGRQYTPEGQEIEARIISQDDCPILNTTVWKLRFIDRSRAICGDVELLEVTQQALMLEYDAGRYTGLWTGAF